MMRMNGNHRRVDSTGSFSSINFCDQYGGSGQNYFSSLDNFMSCTKLMEDEVMVPSKLKDKNLSIKNGEIIPCKPFANGTVIQTVPTITSPTTNGNGHHHHHQQAICKNSDILDHYKFLRLIRNQFLSTKPFCNNLDDEDDFNISTELLKDNEEFKQKYENLKYHFNELMLQLDTMSSDAKAITEIYRNNV